MIIAGLFVMIFIFSIFKGMFHFHKHARLTVRALSIFLNGILALSVANCFFFRRYVVDEFPYFIAFVQIFYFAIFTMTSYLFFSLADAAFVSEDFLKKIKYTFIILNICVCVLLLIGLFFNSPIFIGPILLSVLCAFIVICTIYTKSAVYAEHAPNILIIINIFI